MEKRLAVEIISRQQTQKLQACGSALVCSGTAAFECAMLKIPMVVLYRCHWFNYLLISCLARVSWASLPNLILQSGIVPELLQSRCRVDLILTHLRVLTQNSPMRKQQLQALTHLSDHMLSAQNNKTRCANCLQNARYNT